MFDLNELLDELKARVDEIRDEAPARRAMFAKNAVTDLHRARCAMHEGLALVFEVAFEMAPQEAWDAACRTLSRDVPAPAFPYVPKHRKEGAAA